MSTLVWNLIEAEAETRIRVDEPALTSVGLTWLKLAARGSIRVDIHPQRKEGQVSGADFELWITNGPQGVGMVVQAKRVGPIRRRFHTLHKTAASNWPQGDMLMSYAKRHKLWPLYLLYTNARSPDEYQWNSCAGATKDDSALGCMAASPKDIRNLRPRRETGIVEVLKKSIPWHCLVCPPAPSASEPLDDIERRLSDLGIDHPDNREPPSYVLRSLGVNERDDEPTESNSEERSPDWLLVVDLQQPSE